MAITFYGPEEMPCFPRKYCGIKNHILKIVPQHSVGHFRQESFVMFPS